MALSVIPDDIMFSGSKILLIPILINIPLVCDLQSFINKIHKRPPRNSNTPLHTHNTSISILT